MTESDTAGEDQPVIEPRVIRFLKDRRKLIGGDIRNEFWEELDNRVTERRKPDTAAERTLENLIREIEDASFPVARRRMRDRLARANENRLNRL